MAKPLTQDELVAQLRATIAAQQAQTAKLVAAVEALTGGVPAKRAGRRAPRTPEQRTAASERMRLMHAQKKAAREAGGQTKPRKAAAKSE